MKDDSEYPRLTPPDDRLPARDRLLRRPEELTDEQFDLLAAAWSEEALSGDHLSELEAAMTCDTSRRRRAESFRKVKLVPYDDRWPGRNRMLKTTPASVAIRRSLLIITAAAAVMALIIISPAVTRQATRATDTAPADQTAMAEALIPAPVPVVVREKKVDASAVNIRGHDQILQSSVTAATLSGSTHNPSAGESALVGAASDSPPVSAEAGRIILADAARVTAGSYPDLEISGGSNPITIDLNRAAAMPLLVAAADNSRLRPVEMNPAISTSRQTPVSAEISDAGKETNWILRSFSALAKAVTKEEKKIDGYYVASACVTGINNLLGWEMELKQTRDARGEPQALNFSSSLLSFSAPVKKNAP